MATSPGEYEIQQRIRLACGRGATRLWRNNTGALIDRQGRLVRFGLCKVGLRRVEITAAMVGQHIGQFIAIEVKTPQGAIRPEQESYLRLVQQFGGVAAICRSLEEARTVLEPTAGVGLRSNAAG